MGRLLGDQVFMPRLACVRQRGIEGFSGPLIQVDHLGVCDCTQRLARVPLQRPIYQLEAAQQKFQMVAGERDKEPLVGAPGWINNEVGEGLMKRPNWEIGAQESQKRLDGREPTGRVSSKSHSA